MKKNDFVSHYFSRLEHWKKQMNLKGYSNEIFKLAQKEVKEYLK